MHPELFISYCRSDKYKILPIIEYLKKLGASLWFDENDIYGASFWSAEIVDAIENCKVILLFLSQEATQSNNVTKELQLGLEESKDILPILLESIEIPRTMKYALAGIQFIDAAQNNSGCIATIISSLNHLGITLNAHSNCIEDLRLDSQLHNALIRLQSPPRIYLRKNIVESIARRVIHGKFPVTLIQGLPGSGKTALSCEVLKNIAHNFEQIFAFNFSGPHAYEFTYFIEELNLNLQQFNRNVLNKRLESLTPERALEFLLVQMSDISSIFIFDNLDELDLTFQKHMIKTLSVLPKLKVLITVTTRPEGIEHCHLVTVDPFSKYEALEFINENQLLPEKLNTNELLDQLPESIYSNPLFLITLLSQLKDFSLEMLLNQGINHITEEATHVIKEALNLLSNEEIKILLLVAMLPEQDIKKSFDILKIKLPNNIFKILKLLIARSLLIHVGKGYIVPETVSRTLVNNNRKKTLSISKKITNNWCNAIQFTSDHVHSLQDIASLGTGITHALYKWQFWEQLDKLTNEENLEVLNMAGIWKEYSTILNLSIKAATSQNNYNKKIILSCRLARKHYQLGNFEGAKQLIEECNLLASEKEQSTTLKATIQNHRIFLFDQIKYPKRALRELYKSRILYKKINDDIGLRTVERLIGQLYLRIKCYSKARDAYFTALEYFAAEEITKEKIEIEIDLSLCDLETGNINDVEERLRNAIESSKSINYQCGLPRAFLILSQTLCSLTRFKEALSTVHQAIYYGEHLNKNVYLTALLIKSKIELLTGKIKV